MILNLVDIVLSKTFKRPSTLSSGFLLRKPCIWLNLPKQALPRSRWTHVMGSILFQANISHIEVARLRGSSSPLPPLPHGFSALWHLATNRPYLYIRLALLVSHGVAGLLFQAVDAGAAQVTKVLQRNDRTPQKFFGYWQLTESPHSGAKMVETGWRMNWPLFLDVRNIFVIRDSSQFLNGAIS